MWSSTSHVARQHHGQRVSKPRRTSGRCYAGRTSSDISLEESLDILQLDSTALDAAELRQAYYSRMRELHPDVNPGGETTEAAAQVNAAYTALLQVRGLPLPKSIHTQCCSHQQRPCTCHAVMHVSRRPASPTHTHSRPAEPRQPTSVHAVSHCHVCAGTPTRP